MFASFPHLGRSLTVAQRFAAVLGARHGRLGGRTHGLYASHPHLFQAYVVAHRRSQALWLGLASVR